MRARAQLQELRLRVSGLSGSRMVPIRLRSWYYLGLVFR